MRLIDVDPLGKRACELEEQARLRLSIIERNGGLFNTEWKIWSAILKERTAFKRMLDRLPTVNEWIPVNEDSPEKEQYVLVSTDMNRVATATFKGNYWNSVFDLDWEEVLAWMELPKPYEEEENEKTVEGKEI